MTDREMIEARCNSEGLTITGWSDTDDGETAALGRWTVLTNDYEDEGFYEGDNGDLTACVVGAEEYNNRRVAFTFTPDGMDSGLEIRDLAILGGTDE